MPNTIDLLRHCDSCADRRPKDTMDPSVPIPMTPDYNCARPGGLCAKMQAFADDVARSEQEPDPVGALTTEISAPRAAELAQVQNDVALADKAVLDSAETFKALGQIEGLDFLRHVADVAAAQAFEKIKKNKSYKNLPYIDAEGNRRHVADLDEFCEAFLGKSARRVRELAQNLHVLGSDLYESAERIGFKARDYRALKALPPEDQETIKQAIASESKDDVLSILEDLAAKHQSEREASKKRETDLTADLEARGKLLEDKAARLTATEEELYKLKSLPPDEQTALQLAREEEAVKGLNSQYMEALAGLNGYLRQTADVLAAEGVSEHTSQYAIGQVRALCEEINGALIDLGIPVDFAEIVTPEWLREQAETDLRTGHIADTDPAARGI